jgi:hypothetical protein
MKYFGYYFKNRGETIKDAVWLDIHEFYTICPDLTMASLRALAEDLIEYYNDDYAGEVTEMLLSENQILVFVDASGDEMCTLSVCTEACLQYTATVVEDNGA